MINLTPVLRSLKRRCYDNRLIFGRVFENRHTPPSFFALAFHNGLKNRNAVEHHHTGDDPCTSDKNLVNFGPTVTPELDCVIWGKNWRKG